MLHVLYMYTFTLDHLAWEFKKPFIISYIMLYFIQPKVKGTIFFQCWSCEQLAGTQMKTKQTQTLHLCSCETLCKTNKSRPIYLIVCISQAAFWGIFKITPGVFYMSFQIFSKMTRLILILSLVSRVTLKWNEMMWYDINHYMNCR